MEFSNPFEQIPPAPIPGYLHADQYVCAVGAVTQPMAQNAEGQGIDAAQVTGGKRYRIFGFTVMPSVGGGGAGVFKFYQTLNDTNIRPGVGRALFEMSLSTAVVTPFVAAVPPTGVALDPGVGILLVSQVLGAEMSVFVAASAVIE